MSKSLGNVIDPMEMKTKYSSDVFRYCLLRDGVPHSDGSKKWRAYCHSIMFIPHLRTRAEYAVLAPSALQTTLPSTLLSTLQSTLPSALPSALLSTLLSTLPSTLLSTLLSTLPSTLLSITNIFLRTVLSNHASKPLQTCKLLRLEVLHVAY